MSGKTACKVNKAAAIRASRLGLLSWPQGKRRLIIAEERNDLRAKEKEEKELE